MSISLFLYLFFINHTASNEIYTLSLHDALPISTDLPVSASAFQTTLNETGGSGIVDAYVAKLTLIPTLAIVPARDRKSTRLNSSHVEISYAVFCLKKKKIKYN